MKLRPKPLLKKKKGIILKPKKVPKRFPLSTQNKSWTDEEREEFILNSYTGKYNPANSRWSNFPYKPEMLRREVISSIERLEELAVKWRNVPVFAFDTETNTLRVASDNKDFRCVCITFSWGENDNYEIPLGYLREEDVEAGRNLDFQRVVEIIKPIFENPNVMLVGHNLKFDLHVLARIGIFPVTKLMFDTMLSSWICDENTPNGLKENSAEKMGVPQQHFKEVTDSIPNEVKKRFGYKANSKVYDFGLVLIDDGEFYCIGDSFFTWCNFLGFRKEIIDEKMDKIYYHKMVPFLKVLFKMEEQGTTVDVETLKRMQKEMEEDIEKLSYAIIEIAGCVFNIGSSVQKSLLLYGLDDYELDFDIYLEKYKKKNAKRLAKSKNGIDVKEVQRKYLEKKNDKERLNILKHSFNFPVSSYTASNSPSTDSDAIWRISKKTYKNNRRKQEGADMCKLILEYSKLSKLKTAFADGILEQLYEDGKAHPSFNQIGCVEGNTLIPTDKGLFPIQSLKESWVDGVRLSSNLSVVNRYGFIEKSSHLVQFKDVETKKIKTHLGVELECSNIHPILCNTFTTTEYYANKDSCRSRGIFYSETSKVWIKAEDLTTDNYVFVPVGYNTFSAKNYSFDLSGVTYGRNTNAKEFKIPDSMSKELAEFLGIYYADGSIHSNNGTFSIRITNSNYEVLNRVKYLSMKLFGVEAIVYDTGETDREVNITSIGLAPIEFLYEMKRGCVNKLIPNCVLQSRRESIISFIKGLTLDSHIVFEDKKTYLVIVVSNKISASYLQSILFNLGIISSVTQDKSKTDNVFRVSIYNEEYEKFRDTIGFIEKSKFVYITKNQNHSNNYIKVDKGIWLKIKSIESGFNTVYDFSVPETHSFISGSIISHNTDSGRLSCIAEGTLVKVVGGDKPIEQIKKGDLVYCYDDKGVVRISKVLKTMNNGVRPCVDVTWKSTGMHEEGHLICTPDHKIRMTDGTWAEAQYLTEGDSVTHLRRSNDQRPRLYGLNSFCEQEQIVIKKQLFKCNNPNVCIHHEDEDKSNNDIDNLSLKYKPCHTRLHSRKFAEEGKIKTEHLMDEKYRELHSHCGENNVNYIHTTVEDLERMVHEAKGIIRNIPMDFDTFKKKKCAELNFDYKKVAGKYQKQYVTPGRKEFTDSFMKHKGKREPVMRELGIGRIKFDNLVREYDLCYNHKIINVTPCGSRHVYDLEVEEYHNFIAGEVCVHNCSSPNLQQLPKAEEDDKYQIRSVFIGSDYSCNSDGTYKSDEVSVWDRKKGNVKRKKIIAIDYHNLEMVCLTHFSHDKNLSEMFANDDDAHGSTAVNMFNLDCTPVECKKKYPHLRQVSKTLNFLLMYGGGAKLLYENLKADHYAPLDLGGEEFLKQYSCRTGEEVAQCIIDKYFTTYSGVAQFIAKQKKFAHKNGYVRTILGRKRRLPDINSRDMKKSSYCERLSVNSAIQGTAGDITISAQLRIDSEERLKELGCNMLIQVHDELVFECPEENLEEAIEIIKYDMEHPFGDTEDRMVKYLRADYDFGSSYQEAK